VATGDFGPGRMPPDMFLNCNEEIKRQKEQTIRSQNMLVSRICSRIRARARIINRGRGFLVHDTIAGLHGLWRTDVIEP
jgi:hypothetical protein